MQFTRVAINPDSVSPGKMMDRFSVPWEVACQMAAQAMAEEMYLNDDFQVTKSAPWNQSKRLAGFPPVVHLSIIRRDGQRIRDWAVLQEIKNSLMGPEHEAVEVFPAKSRLVDMGHNYHLWVFVDKEFRIPFGWNFRMVKGEQR